MGVEGSCGTKDLSTRKSRGGVVVWSYGLLSPAPLGSTECVVVSEEGLPVVVVP